VSRLYEWIDRVIDVVHVDKILIGIALIVCNWRQPFATVETFGSALLSGLVIGLAFHRVGHFASPSP